jgi:hypothetical protein
MEHANDDYFVSGDRVERDMLLNEKAADTSTYVASRSTESRIANERIKTREQSLPIMVGLLSSPLPCGIRINVPQIG